MEQQRGPDGFNLRKRLPIVPLLIAGPITFGLRSLKDLDKLAITLGSDETHKMLKAYGVWQEKTLYGRKFLGVVRATFLIDPQGRIAQVWPKVSVAGHAEAVLAAVKTL